MQPLRKLGRPPRNLRRDLRRWHYWALRAYISPSPQPTLITPLTPTQYNDNVIGSGANYNDAYFEIKNIRAYTTGGVAPTPTANYQGTIPTITGTSALQSSTSTVGTALIPTPWYYPGAAVSDVRVGMGKVMGAVAVIVVLSGFLL